MFKQLLQYRPRHVRKAIAGAIGAAVVPFVAAIADLDITRNETGLILASAVAGAAAVFGVKANAPIEPKE